MEHSSLDIRQFQGIRRWPRYEIDLPVRILALNGVPNPPVEGRGHEISRAGMALHASVPAQPGVLLQLQFPTSEASRVIAIVRNRKGNSMGLEFLSQLSPDDTKNETMRPAGVSRDLRKVRTDSCTAQALYAGLRRKQEEQERIQKEIQALRLAIALLADDQKEIRLIPPRTQVDVRPWPLQS
jgi:hypothetical protein